MSSDNPIESLLALAAGVFNAYSVVLFDAPENGASHICAAFSRGDEIDRTVSIRPGRGIVGWILRNDSPIAVGAIDENQTNLGYYKEGNVPDDVRSFVGCPVPGGGILCVDSFEKAFAPSQQSLIGYFAQTLSVLRRHESPAPETGRKWLEALSRQNEMRIKKVGWKSYLNQLLVLLQQTTSFQYAAFAARPEGSDSYFVEAEYPPVRTGLQLATQLSVNDGMLGWVFRNEEPFISDGSCGGVQIFAKDEKGLDFQSAVCIPVMLDRSARGVLCIASSRQEEIGEGLRYFMTLSAGGLGDQLEAMSLRYALRKHTGAR